MNHSVENNSLCHTKRWSQRFLDACSSSQMLSVGILLNFLVLAATFVGKEAFITNNFHIISVYNFSGIIFISALLSSIIWLFQAVCGKTHIEYFKQHHLFVFVEQITFAAWLLCGVSFSVFDFTFSESTTICLFTAICGIGMFSYFLIMMFACRVSEKPQKKGNKNIESILTSLTIASVTDELI